MNTTTKKEVKGTQGVNASQTKGSEPKDAVNGELPKETPAPANKSKTIEEQMKYFDGLSSLVNIKRRFETHRDVLAGLIISDEELVKFESERRHGVRITLHDESNDEYVINNPKLVKDVQSYLITVLRGKIAEYNEKIMLFGQN